MAGRRTEPRVGRSRTGVRLARIAGLLVLLLGLGVSCAPPPAPETRRASIFTTSCAITLHDHASEAAFEAAFAALRLVDERYSMWRDGSELDSLNRAAGKGAVRVSPELVAMLGRGLELARLTMGRYDPSVGPLVRLWGVGTERESVPETGAISLARSLVDWNEVLLDAEAGTVELAREGMALDFGSLAKGEGAVRAGEALEAAGVRAAVVDVGGSVLVLGGKPGGKPWRIGIQRPGSTRGEMIGVVELRDAAVNTSGIYERWFEAEGRRWNHVIDTQSGWPLDNGLVSATVIRHRSQSADGPSLALLVLGAKAGLALAEELGWAAILIDVDRRVYLSSKARPLFSLTDTSYSLAHP